MEYISEDEMLQRKTGVFMIGLLCFILAAANFEHQKQKRAEPDSDASVTDSSVEAEDESADAAPSTAPEPVLMEETPAEESVEKDIVPDEVPAAEEDIALIEEAVEKPPIAAGGTEEVIIPDETSPETVDRQDEAETIRRFGIFTDLGSAG